MTTDRPPTIIPLPATRPPIVIPPALAPLAAERRWVVWKSIWKTGKDGRHRPTKPPFCADNPGRHASTDDPSTWSDLKTAMLAYTDTEKRCEGIGFVLTDSDIAAFDIDDCRDDSTEAIHPWAQDLLRRSGSYAEVTPSGEGIRIIGRCRGGPVHRKFSVPNANGVSCELYRKAKRFITITGNQIGEEAELVDLDTLLDETLAELVGAQEQPGTGGVNAGARREHDLDNLIKHGCGEDFGGDRSRAVWFVINESLRQGRSADEIVALLLDRGNGISAHIYNQSQPEQYARKQVEKAQQERATDDAAVHAVVTRPPPEPLPYVDLALDLKPREWLVPERIPMRNVTLLSGEGAVGKSILLMQLSGAAVLGGQEWIGTRPAEGPALYVSCEEEDDEIRRRLEAVATHLNTTRRTLIERGLRVLSFAGRDAILGQPDRAGIIKQTPLLEHIRREVLQLRPRLVVLDTVADTFGGKEIDRAQTRQYVTLMRGLAIDSGSAVVLAAHPSLEGIRTDTGLSGSTGWHNSVRARMYLKPAGDDPTLRVLEVRKNNYGPVSENILLRWRDGVYVVDAGKGTFEQRMAEVETGILFMDLLRQVTEQGRNVSDKPSSSYAPTVFAAQPKAKEARATKKALAEAMTRLFAANKIRVFSFGPPSKMRTKIVEVSNAPSNPPSDAFQPAPTGVCTTPPNTPSPVGRSKGALEAPAPPNGEGLAIEPGLSPSEMRGHAQWYEEEANRRRVDPEFDQAALDRDLRARLADHGVLPEFIAGEFERVMQVVFAVSAAKPSYEVIGWARPDSQCEHCSKGLGIRRIKYGGQEYAVHLDCADDYVKALAKAPDLGLDESHASAPARVRRGAVDAPP